MNQNAANEQCIVFLLILLVIWLALKYRRPFRPSGYAHGTARWASERDLRRGGMLSGSGLILGRTPRRGKRISLSRYKHVSVTAPTGAGKGVSFVIPALLTYKRGSVFVFDPKGELYFATAAARRATETPAYYSGPGAAPHYVYGKAGLSRQESLTLGAGLLAALGVYIWRKRRRNYCDLPA